MPPCPPSHPLIFRFRHPLHVFPIVYSTYSFPMDVPVLLGSIFPSDFTPVLPSPLLRFFSVLGVLGRVSIHLYMCYHIYTTPSCLNVHHLTAFLCPWKHTVFYCEYILVWYLHSVRGLKNVSYIFTRLLYTYIKAGEKRKSERTSAVSRGGDDSGIDTVDAIHTCRVLYCRRAHTSAHVALRT